ncbi:hypothetical protein B0H13DRAFT_1859270 [Mycena leptocephala]|nr:hypothetical protein B0H13DRAFT_1859270 [Mycena leptocephala]
MYMVQKVFTCSPRGNFGLCHLSRLGKSLDPQEPKNHKPQPRDKGAAVAQEDARRLETAQDRERKRRERRNRGPRPSEQYGKGDIAPASRVRVVNPSAEEWSLWIHLVSFVPARVKGDVYAPRPTTSTTGGVNQRTASCRIHARWMSVEGILNVADRDDSGPIALLDGGSQKSVCTRSTVASVRMSLC